MSSSFKFTVDQAAPGGQSHGRTPRRDSPVEGLARVSFRLALAGGPPPGTVTPGPRFRLTVTGRLTTCIEALYQAQSPAACRAMDYDADPGHDSDSNTVSEPDSA